MTTRSTVRWIRMFARYHEWCDGFQQCVPDRLAQQWAADLRID